MSKKCKRSVKACKMSLNFMLFTSYMKSIFIYSIFCFLLLAFSCSDYENDEFEEIAKIAIREVGNQLLLANQDSTSLVAPVKNIELAKYRLAFQNKLSFNPDSLVSIITYNFEKSELPRLYRVEVKQCEDGEVAYSYQKSANQDKTIVPCSGRVLPFACYYVEVRFINKSNSKYPIEYILFVLGAVIAVFLLFFLIRKKNSTQKIQESYIEIGRFKFYETQNKLIKEAVEISLSKKESELLAILVSSPNTVVTRDELTKRVWEDNGVIVGRSLDTFISKLRKKFKNDDSIKLTNVHGVGYKLEVF